MPTTTARWVQRDHYCGTPTRTDQCRFCGRCATGDCRPVACLLCATVQCHGNGSGNGRCAVCLYGYLPGWSRTADQNTCGYKGCTLPAVSKAPRVHRVCARHATTTRLRIGPRFVTLVEYATEQTAHRDSGRGWQHWRLAQ